MLPKGINGCEHVITTWYEQQFTQIENFIAQNHINMLHKGNNSRWTQSVHINQKLGLDFCKEQMYQ